MNMRLSPPQYCPKCNGRVALESIVVQPVGRHADSEGVTHPYYAMVCGNCYEMLGYIVTDQPLGSNVLS
jgi:hypothetical protein